MYYRQKVVCRLCQSYMLYAVVHDSVVNKVPACMDVFIVTLITLLWIAYYTSVNHDMQRRKLLHL